MNPWQHPIFDENIHLLLALVSSLCRGCGGVVYLMADDAQTVTQENIKVYQERLYALIDKNIETPSLMTNMAQVSLLLGTHKSWAALFLKRSCDELKQTSLETGAIWKPLTLAFDLSGQIYTKPDSDSQSESYRDMGKPVVSAVPGAASPALSTYSQENNPFQTEPDIPSESGIIPLTAAGHSNGTAIPKVNFSSCQSLDWAENTKNTKGWQKYVKIKEVKIDDIIESCPMLNPTQPMTITPDRESIRYLFESEKDMEETLWEVTIKEPGFAIVCRTWRFHISDDNAIEHLPPGHICDILTVTDTGRLTFWVVGNISDESTFESQMEYLMTTGRMLKFQIVQKTAGDCSNLWIDCRLFCITTPTNIENTVKLRSQECQDIQRHIHRMCREGVDIDVLQQAVAKLILSKESPLKRCAGDQTSIFLTLQQAEVLMHKAKVNYITGPAGSGKSYTGTFLYKMYGKKSSVYICTRQRNFGNTWNSIVVQELLS